MIPLPPPVNYFKELQSQISNFLFRMVKKKKKTRIHLSTLQQMKLSGGLALPDFELYYWSFQVKSLTIWCDKDSVLPWRQMEQELVKPHRIEDLLFARLIPKSAHTLFGPIIGYSLQVWSAVQSHMGCSTKLCDHFPIWYNYNLLQNFGPYFNASWASRGVYILQDLYGENGLKSFQDLKVRYSLPGFSWFLYLQLRSAIKAHGVPWDSPLPVYPLSLWINPGTSCTGLISRIYAQLISKHDKALGVIESWNRDLKERGVELDWGNVWNNVFISSKNPVHQLIYFKFVQKFYLSPYRCFKMKLTDTPVCTKCNLNMVGTYLHIIWDRPDVSDLWSQVAVFLEDILPIFI